MADDLEILAPTPGEVTAQGEAISLSPFFFGQFPKVIGLLRQINQQISGLNLIRIVTEGKKVNVELADNWPALLPQVLEVAGEPWIALLGLAINKPRSWFDTLPADEGLALSRVLIQVNSDFFVQKVLPMIPVAKDVPEAPADGEASSPVSEATDIAAPKSTE